MPFRSRLSRPHPRDLRRWAVGFSVLLAVWLLVGVTIRTAGVLTPRADAVVAEAQQVATLPADPAARSAALRELAERVQRLSLDDRLDPELVQAVEAAVGEMTPDEQRAFVRDILPPGLEPMIQAYRAMDETQRRLATDRMRREFKHAGWIDEGMKRGDFSELVEASVEAFVAADDPRAQLNLLPTMQQLLRAMQTR